MECGAFDAGHLLETLAGVESFSSGLGLEDAGVRYATTVLKLNGTDLFAIAGQEGVGAAIKAGGKKAYDMVVAFLKSIKDYFFGPKGTKQDQAVTKASNAANEIEKELKDGVKKDGAITDKNIGKINTTVNAVKEVVNKETVGVKFKRSKETFKDAPKTPAEMIKGASENGVRMTVSTADIEKIDMDMDRLAVDIAMTSDNSDFDTDLASKQIVDTAHCGNLVAKSILDIFKSSKTLLGKASGDLEQINKRTQQLEDHEKKPDELREVKLAGIFITTLIDHLTSNMRIAANVLIDLVKKMNAMLASLMLMDKEVENFAKEHDIKEYDEALSMPLKL